MAWFDITYLNARAAPQQYLALPALQRGEVRPQLHGHTAATLTVERFMRKHMLRAMPSAIQRTLLQMSGIACADVLFAALVDAGPGAEHDWAHTR